MAVVVIIEQEASFGPEAKVTLAAEITDVVRTVLVDAPDDLIRIVFRAEA